VGAGAKILGAITIGENSRVGANAVVVKSAPANSVIVGVPGQVVERSKPRPLAALPDLEHGRLPDTIGDSLVTLLAHVQALEARLDTHFTMPTPHLPDHGVWHGEDFSI
jgi:serine O-acetyltransferase